MNKPSGQKALDSRIVKNTAALEVGNCPAAACSGSVPASLRHQASWTAALHLVVLWLFFGSVHRMAPTFGALAGGAIAVVVLVLVHLLLWRHLPENRLLEAIEVSPRLGSANHLTLWRGVLISLTAGFLFATPPGSQAVVAWLPGILYLTAALLDGLDGAWARKTHSETFLGRTLDVRYDALGVLVASVVAITTHRLPAYYLAAGAAYYVFQLGLRFRRRRGNPVHPTGPRTFARLVAGFQMGFLGFALLPVFSETVLAMAAPVFLLPLLAGFVWDWLVVTGGIGEVGARRGERFISALITNGPLLLRGILLISGGRLFFRPLDGMLPESLIVLPGLVLMVATGFLGRTAALLMGLLLACQASIAGVAPWLATMMGVSLILMLTGTGALSLWRPEDALLLGRSCGRRKPRRLAAGCQAKEAGRSSSGRKPLAARRAAGQILALAAVAGLLYWAWRDVPLGAVTAAIGRWGWWQWMLFAVLNLFILVAMCWRWAFILRRMGYPVAFAALMGCRMGANTLSYITPGPQFGGEPFQAHCLAVCHRVPGDVATASVVVDRLVELLGNLLFLALAGLLVLPALLAKSDALLPVTIALLAALLLVGVLLYSMAAGARPFSRMVGKVGSLIGRPQRVSGMVSFLQAGESRAAGLLTDRLWGWYILGALMQWSGFLAELWLIYVFMGMSLSAAELLTLAVAARLAFLLPLPGGLGALEASQMLAITTLGGDPAVAAAACGIMRARDLVLISFGGVLAVRGTRPDAQHRSRPPLTPA